MKQKIHTASTVQGSIYGLCRISKRVSAVKVEEYAAVKKQLLQNGLKDCPEGLCQAQQGSCCDGRDELLNSLFLTNGSCITICLRKYEGSSAYGLHDWFIVVVISMQGVTKSRLCPSCSPWPPLKVSRQTADCLKASFNSLPLTTLQFNEKQLNK